MSRCRAYIDLDETLLTGVETVSGLMPRVRPDAGWFLRMMSTHCDLWLLTRANKAWAEEGLQAIGPTASVFVGMISREDLLPIQEQIEVIFNAGLSENETDALLREIPPIAPAGVIFDDFQIGSFMYWIKALAVGIGEYQWIQVEEFSKKSPDRGGLHKAYLEFKRKFVHRPIVGITR
jgi:hypothetical protein